MSLLERLAGLGLLVVTGKGGVGKTTLTAALGRLFARRGRRTLLLEIDPRESLYPFFDVDPSGGAIVEIDRGLWVQNLGPQAVLDELVRERLRIGPLVKRLSRSPIYRHFTATAPGLREMAALGHAARVLRGLSPEAPEIDLLVLDAPATGHGVSMLAAPSAVSEVIRDGPFGQMAGELARFIADPLSCGVVIATAAEEMPVQEALESIASLDDRLARRPELLVVNGVYPRPAAAAATASTDAVELWRHRREVNERELERLRAAWDGPCVELPLVPLDRGPELAERLSAELERRLGEDPP